MEAVLDTRLTPWEQRRVLGAIEGFSQTLRGTALSPKTFFDTLSPETSWTGAFVYGWVLQALFAVAAALISLLSRGTSPLDTIALYPIAIPVLAALVHLIARLTGGTRGGFPVTLRALCYSGVLLPLAGDLVGPSPLALRCLALLGLWGQIVCLFALSRLQRMNIERAALALFGAELAILGTLMFVAVMVTGGHVAWD